MSVRGVRVLAVAPTGHSQPQEAFSKPTSFG
jgi:hypothetical protein